MVGVDTRHDGNNEWFVSFMAAIKCLESKRRQCFTISDKFILLNNWSNAYIFGGHKKCRQTYIQTKPIILPLPHAHGGNDQI